MNSVFIQPSVKVDRQGFVFSFPWCVKTATGLSSPTLCSTWGSSSAVSSPTVSPTCSVESGLFWGDSLSRHPLVSVPTFLMPQPELRGWQSAKKLGESLLNILDFIALFCQDTCKVLVFLSDRVRSWQFSFDLTKSW